MQTGKNELYNLQDHIGETNDLIGLYPGKAKQPASMPAQRLRNWKSPMPLIKSTDKLVPVPDEL